MVYTSVRIEIPPILCVYVLMSMVYVQDVCVYVCVIMDRRVYILCVYTHMCMCKCTKHNTLIVFAHNLHVHGHMGNVCKL